MTRSLGARAWPGAVFLTLAIFGVTPPASAQCEIDKFTGSGVNQKDQFGFSLAAEGLLAAAGCFKCDDQGGESGAVYVFAYDGYAWIQTGRLAATDGAPFDHLGTDVALDPGGAGAVAGAPDDDRPLLTDAGAAYVFFDAGASWVQHAKLTASDAANGAHFGFALATDGVLVAVGAPDEAGGGAVYLFRLFGAQWLEVQKLEAPDAHPGAQFGYDVAFDGTTLAVGSRRFDRPGAVGAGKVYLYVQAGPTWTLQDTVASIDPMTGDNFGSSLSIDGGRLVVGAPHDDDQGFGPNSNTGVAFHFARSGSSWSFVEKILPPATSHGFSIALALDGDSLLVGAYLDKEIGADGGSAHVFELDGGSFDHVYKILLSDHVPLSEVGGAVALAGDLALVSSEFDDDVASNAGAVYGFSVSERNCQPLYAWPDTISLSAGGAQAWTLDIGLVLAGSIYWVLGSLTDAGGFFVGPTFVPLAPDAYFKLTIQAKNGPNLPNSLGVLDANGDATAAIVLPPGGDPGLAGLELFHAYVLDHPVFGIAFGSNLTKVVLVP